MKRISTLLVALFVAGATYAQTTWNIDPTHSNIKFNVTHLVISEVSGNFGKFEGSVVSESKDFAGADVAFKADVNSINTGNDGRDKHLKSDDFLNAEKFPNISFTGNIEKKSEGYYLIGTFTMRDVTKKVAFPAKYNGTITDPYGNIKAGFKVTGTVNRKEYGVNFGAVMDAGGAVVSDEVEIVCNIEVAQAK